MKALISGGGIAGLATGVALRTRGIEVEIFERAPELSEIGAGLMIWPNGARSLRALGVEFDALPLHTLRLCSWRGRRLSLYPLDPIGQRFGFQPCFVHRADLQSALANRFGNEGIYLGADLLDFKEAGNGVEVLLRNGRSAHGDFVVGADGLRSAVRRQLLGDGEPVYLGSTIWRGIAPGRGFDLELGSGVNWIGRGSEFLAFHLKGGRIYWAGVTKEPAEERAGPRGHKGDLTQRFRDWAEPVPQLIATTDEVAILRNDMYDRRLAKRWSHGKVTLVGDATHPMTPNAGQGACQALEDAVALGESFAQEPGHRRRIQRLRTATPAPSQPARRDVTPGNACGADRECDAVRVARRPWFSPHAVAFPQNARFDPDTVRFGCGLATASGYRRFGVLVRI